MFRSPWAGFVALVGEKQYCKPIPLNLFLSFIRKLLLEQVVFLTCVAMVWQLSLAMWGIYYSTLCPRVQRQMHRSNSWLVLPLSHDLWQGDRGGRAMDVMIPPSVSQNKPSTQVDKRKASEEQCCGPQLCIGGMMLAQLFTHHSANVWV